MSTIAITSADDCNPRRYIQVMQSLGAEIRRLSPYDQGSASASAETLLRGAGGLLLPGGPDVDPPLYGAEPDPTANLEVCRPLDDLDLKLLNYALDRDMPVLAICRGMQLLNVAFGGTLLQDLPGHNATRVEGQWVPQKHFIYLSPGAKTAAIIGNGGFFRVNSWHHQGLKEPQRSPRLMSTAYSMEDGIIEGLESPAHSWVIGLQCHPERQDEVPRNFANLFIGFLERAERYLAAQHTSDAP
jgi:putative glutamine amidotransferase